MEDILEYLKQKAKVIDDEIAAYLSQKPSERYIEKILGKANYKYDPVALGKSVLEPSWYLFTLGGKRWRPTLTMLFMEALGKNAKNYIEFAIIPEVIHTATLVHDDIEDNSDTRRGSPAAHIKYGIDVATNVGDFMFFFPMLALAKSDKLDEQTKNKAMSSYITNMTRVTIGQATDIAWHKFLVDTEKITEAQYLQMAFDKTGVLARFACHLGTIIGGGTDKQIEAAGNFGATIGVAFQIQDDLLNITESKLSVGKGGIGDDISEGKITLAVIETLSKATKEEKQRLIGILSMHTKDKPLIAEAVNIINKHTSREQLAKLQKRLMDEAWEQVDKAFPDSEAKKMLKLLSDFLVNRSV